MTNNRERPCPHDVPVSRGSLILEFFHSDASDAFEERLLSEAHHLANANYVYGSFASGRFHWFGIHAGRAQGRRCIDLDAKTFVIANGGIDAHWAKEERGRELFDAACVSKSADPVTELLEVLSDQVPCPMATSPQNTSLTPEQEHLISPIYLDSFEVADEAAVKKGIYATLSSTIVLVDHQGLCSMYEFTRHPAEQRVEQHFTLSQSRQ